MGAASGVPGALGVGSAPPACVCMRECARVWGARVCERPLRLLRASSDQLVPANSVFPTWVL